MEDAHLHLLTIDEDKDASFYAVFDGHGGMCNYWISFLYCFINVYVITFNC